MRKWLFSIITLLFAGSTFAGNLIFPPSFEGMSISDVMIHQSPARDGWVLISLDVEVPEGATPMNGFREDMWQGQLQADKVVANGSGLTPEQAYKTLFCHLNKERQGYACKSTSEVATASTKISWLIPVVVMPPEHVENFRNWITSAGSIPASATRVASAKPTQGDSPQEQYARMIHWGNSSADVPPPEMLWYSREESDRLRSLPLSAFQKHVTQPRSTRAKKVEPKQQNAPIRAVKPGAGGPMNKLRTP